MVCPSATGPDTDRSTLLNHLAAGYHPYGGSRSVIASSSIGSTANARAVRGYSA